jgi:hypothetical protein
MILDDRDLRQVLWQNDLLIAHVNKEEPPINHMAQELQSLALPAVNPSNARRRAVLRVST